MADALTPDELVSLREWAESLADRHRPARLALRLLAEVDRLRALTVALADRCHAQSEALSRRAEPAPLPGHEPDLGGEG